MIKNVFTGLFTTIPVSVMLSVGFIFTVWCFFMVTAFPETIVVTAFLLLVLSVFRLISYAIE